MRLPVPGEIMPDIALITGGGGRVRFSDYRGRRNLVLIFAGKGESDAARQFLGRFSEMYSEFVGEEAEVLTIVQGARDRVKDLGRIHRLPFPVLADEDCRVHSVAGAPETAQDYLPVVYVIDRYGEIRKVFRAEQSEGAYTPQDVLDWVRFVNLECPE